MSSGAGRSARHWGVRAAVGVGLVGGALGALRHPALQRGDVRLGDAIRRAGSVTADRAVVATTDLGSIYAVVGSGVVLAATGRRELAVDVLGAGSSAWVIAQRSKRRVDRRRPYEAEGVRRLIRPPTGSSFPSGHAAVGAAVTAVLADAAPRRAGSRALQAIGAYVAVSRVYVGVHYPTDVVGGAGLGVVIGSLWRGPLPYVWRGGARWLWQRVRSSGLSDRPALRP